MKEKEKKVTKKTSIISTKSDKAKKVDPKRETKKASKVNVSKRTVSKKDESTSNLAFSGTYIQAIGRRKTAVAQVRLYEKGSGDIVINNEKGFDYFKKEENLNLLLQPLKIVSKLKDFNISIIVQGGGFLGQLEASRHGIARALLKYDPEFKAILKTNGFLTRDPRKKERKKPGLKKARKAPQWSKR